LGVINIYQTLEDRGNPDEIEKHGPYYCRRDNAWLGYGYYFWEHYKENAHWWGQEGAGYWKNGYIICEAHYDFDEWRCFDLIKNEKHREHLREALEMMEENGQFKKGITTVARVIEFLRNKLKAFDYDATRANGINSIRRNSQHSNRLNFESQKEQYLDFTPQYQICFYNKAALNLRNYRIIYPEEYIENFVV